MKNEIDRLELTEQRLRLSVDWERAGGYLDPDLTLVTMKRVKLFRHPERIQITRVRLVEA